MPAGAPVSHPSAQPDKHPADDPRSHVLLHIYHVIIVKHHKCEGAISDCLTEYLIQYSWYSN